VTTGAAQTSKDSGADVFISKLSPDGATLVYSSYLGGNSTEAGNAIAVDSAGNAYITGWTRSRLRFTTTGAFQTTKPPSPPGIGNTHNAFVAKINSSGSAFTYVTYLGGSGGVCTGPCQVEFGQGIAVDASGNAYIAGATQSFDFPVTPGAFQTTYAGGSSDGFVAKLSADGSTLIYSTYLGSSRNDGFNGLAINASGEAYVVGAAQNNDYPITANAAQQSYFPGSAIGVVSKLNATGSGLVYSTFLGGGGHSGVEDIALDATGNAFVTGFSGSRSSAQSPPVTDGFPVTQDALQPLPGGPPGVTLDAFVTVITADGSAFSYSSFLGGSGTELASGIDLDSSGNVYVVGESTSSDYPLVNPMQSTYGGIRDTFVAKMTIITNQPPVADAGVVQVAECTGSSSTSVVLNGAASSDPDGDALTYAWSWPGGSAAGVSPSASFPLGTTPVTLIVDDGNGGTATATTSVTVQDTIAPTVNAGADVTLEATSANGAAFDVAAQVTASDSCCAVGVNISPTGPYPVGVTNVTVTGTDCAGNTASDVMVVTVQDTTLPVLNVPADVAVVATGTLTPVTIGTATATDLFAVNVTSDAPAAFPVGTTVVTWTATDANGNVATATQTVVVAAPPPAPGAGDTAEGDEHDANHGVAEKTEDHGKDLKEKKGHEKDKKKRYKKDKNEKKNLE